ncbi:MAG: efflux RND transporter periplasmic adaptor subunit [Planctomycetia bacterium]|nr:efflux RND transporter periplasmic adaptor subunit [Planctomycetia bacterium]
METERATVVRMLPQSVASQSVTQSSAAPSTVVPPSVEPATDTFENRVRSLKLPDHARAPRRTWVWLVGLTFLALVAGGGWWGYHNIGRLSALASNAPAAALADGAPRTGAANDARPTTTPNPSAANAAGGAPSALSTPPAAAVAPGGVMLESTGYIIAAHQILVTPKVSGMVTFLNAEEGRRVEKNEVLAKVESVEFQSDHDLAAAVLDLAKQQLLELEHGNRPEEIAEAKAELEEAEAQLGQLDSDWKRKHDLRNSGILTATELEQAESQSRAMLKKVDRLRNAQKLVQIGPREERIAAARAEVKRREAELMKARWRLDNCTIRAPIAGTILKKNAEEGNVVDARVMNGSFSLCEMADLSDIEAEMMIQERDIARVHVGQRCQVRSDAYPNLLYEGTVSRLMPIADRGKGAIPVRVKVHVPTNEIGVYLRPEMGARVTFLNEDRPPAAAAPTTLVAPGFSR